LITFFSPSQVTEGSEISDFQFEDPDPEHWQKYNDYIEGQQFVATSRPHCDMASEKDSCQNQNKINSQILFEPSL